MVGADLMTGRGVLGYQNVLNGCCLIFCLGYHSSMANTFSCLNIHCVFSTKQRVPVLNPDIRERLWPYLSGIAKQNGMIPKCIGGVSDHVHLLVTLPTTLAVAKAVQLIKAGSSAWIHQTFPNLRNFAWQQGYGAFSVGISQARSITSSNSSNIIEREPFKKSI
jgi:putative transposase